jgi:hypothetical protein
MGGQLHAPLSTLLSLSTPCRPVHMLCPTMLCRMGLRSPPGWMMV